MQARLLAASDEEDHDAQQKAFLTWKLFCSSHFDGRRYFVKMWDKSDDRD